MGQQMLSKRLTIQIHTHHLRYQYKMVSNHSDANNGNTGMHNMMDQDEFDEEPRAYSVTFEDTLHDVSADIPCSNDQANNEEVLHHTLADSINSISQSMPSDIKQIAIAQALFRHRHKLSKSCINDLCDLLRPLGVANVPTDTEVF